jgi:beta-galactosidase
MSDFPDDFVWGAATASYQIEGAATEDGRGPSIWDTFARVPGAIVDGSNGDVADDHYHRYADDIALLAGLGLKAYRFSIAWSRVLPTGTGEVNQAGLDFYRRIAETCHAHGVTPYATLYHWDLPQPLEDAGGWLVRETAERFRDYAVTTVDALSDVISHWTTLNEPWCSSLLGYGAGVHAPGRQLGTQSLHAAHHLLLGHGLAVQALRDRHPELSLGITVNLYSILPASGSELDAEAVRRSDGLQNRLFLDPLLLGRYPADVLEDTGTSAWFGERAGDLAAIATPLDFLGINYYSRHTVAGPADGVFADPSQPSMLPGSERIAFVDTGAPKTDMGWEVHPDGLVDVIEMVHDRAPELPVLITENGAAYVDVVEPDGTVQDKDRQEYFELHVEACREAVRRGLPLRGYFAWSLMDNYEWAFGYTKRFGIVHVDYETQVRTVKASGRWFAELLA